MVIFCMLVNEGTPPHTQQHIKILTGPFAHWDLQSRCNPLVIAEPGPTLAAPALKPRAGAELTTAAASAPPQRVRPSRMRSDAQRQQLSPAFKETLLFGGKVAKQPGGDVATGTAGNVLSLLRASVPRADSSSGNTAKQTISDPHSVAPAGPAPPPAPSSAAPPAATATERTSPQLAQAVGARRREKTVRSGFITSASNQLLGKTNGMRQRGVSELPLARARHLLPGWALQGLTQGTRREHPSLLGRRMVEMSCGCPRLCDCHESTMVQSLSGPTM